MHRNINMKYLKYLLLLVLIPATALTQALPIRNDAPTALRDLGSDLNVGRNFAVDEYGRMQCVIGGGSATIGSITSITTSVVPGTAATNLGKAEDAAHATTHTGVFALGVRNDAAATSFTSDDGDYSPIATDIKGAIFNRQTDLTTGFEQTVGYSSEGSTGPTSTIAGIYGWARVATDTAETGSTSTSIVATSHSAAIGDQVVFINGPAGGSWSFVSAVPDANTITLSHALKGTPANGNTFLIRQPVTIGAVGGQATTDTGTALQVAMGSFGGAAAGGGFIVKTEDAAFGDSDTLVVSGTAREDSMSVDTGAVTDINVLKSDKFGRLHVSTAPEAHLFSCVSAADITDTNSTAVCAADADELYVVLDICCSNTDTAVATRVNILDGATVIHTMVLQTMVVAAPGDSESCQTFPGGIKAAAINTAINAQAITTSAEIRCSIHGYKLPS